MNDYVMYLNEDQKWRKESSKVVVQQLESQGFKNARNLYDSNGNLKSKEQFEKSLSSEEKEKINRAVMNELMNPGIGAKAEDAWNIVKTIAKAGWETAKGPANLGEVAKILTKYPLEQRKRIEQRIKTAASEAGSYEGYVKAAANAYENTQIIKAPPGISQLGSMSGTGVFTPGVQSVYVSPKAINTKGMAYFREFGREVNKMDFSDNTKYQVSFTGATKGAFDAVKSGDEEGLNSIGEKIIKDLIANANYGKTKIAPFKLSAQAIAAGMTNKSAMTITPDREWLKNYLATNKELDNNLLTPTMYNNILTNGITVIGDTKTFNNSLLNSTYMDPLQVYVDRNDSYTYEDPAGNGRWSVEKNKYGTSEYITTLDYDMYDPEQGKMVRYSTGPQLANYGNNLTSQRDIMANQFFGELYNNNVTTYNGGR
jgi:hypothetical protein